MQLGYLDGVDLGREELMQGGFNRGFASAAKLAFNEYLHNGCLGYTRVCGWIYGVFSFVSVL